MSLNELIYQNFAQINSQYMKPDEEHESTTTNETSSSNLQSDVSVVESDADDRQEKNTAHTDDEEDAHRQELPGIGQLYQQNMVSSQMMHLIQVQKSEKIEIEKENAPICKYCNKIFANVSNLNHHVSAIHLNQSKWICSQCGKICSSKSNLKVHLRVHLRVKPYHCRWCSYSCMHHSSIRDHLAKVHPDKSHTPLQPGYLFNSQAVPEPEVFNSMSHNGGASSTDTKPKRVSSEIESGFQSPEKGRMSKKMRVEKQSPVQTVYPATLSSPAQNFQPNHMSSFYSAYMARMLPFMYNPLQYAAALSNSQSAAGSQFLGMLNQGFQMGQGHQSRQNVGHGKEGVFSSVLSGSSSSDEHQTNSSGNYSYSGSSRSSSMSPSNKVNNETSTAIDQESQVRIVSPRTEPYVKTKKTLSIEQMLNTKADKETQTESSCLACPYCAGSQSN
ncbi:gastrula zinc finger -like [Brachionus plicatilis]|uniref:Gastrula zinc finger-like n=1 Tax=Brachionus plicatilis TaxID=10195 RepID=A0A3M7T3W7_BRAPC|nr:gastrula zinc finger -like [Brachionus plicatilis]